MNPERGLRSRPTLNGGSAKEGGAGCRLHLWLLLLGLGMLLADGVLPAEAAIQFDVFLGYDSIVPQNCWLPVVCEIKNDGPPFKGRIEIGPSGPPDAQNRHTEVELPTGTLKRVVIPVFPGTRGYGASWDARLMDERGKLRAEQIGLRSRKEVAPGVPLVGALTRTAGGVPAFPSADAQHSEYQPVAARLLPQLFPDNPLVLQSLSALYLSSEKAPELTDSQVRALFDWLNAGGHLIVGVEQIADITGTRWLQSVMPFDLKEMQPVQRHAELQEWLRRSTARTNEPSSVGSAPMPDPFAARYGARSGRPPRPMRQPVPDAPARATADLRDDFTFEASEMLVGTGRMRDGHVDVAAGDTPLIVTANRGRGRVTLLLFSPEREPVRSWANLPLFWAKLVEAPEGMPARSPAAYAYNSASSDGIFGAMIDTRQVHRLPVGWLLLLLIVYLVVIGPLDQFWLKRIGRPMLTWITFPCYVVLFSLVIYFIGYKLRAGESECSELNLVDVMTSGDHAELRGQTYMSVYSPVNQRYPLESQQDFAAFRPEMSRSYGRDTAERAAVTQVGDGFKAEIFVPVWTSQLFVSDWWQQAPTPLEVAITPRGDGWQVKVENHTERNLTEAKLAIREHIIPLGDIPAGDTKTFDVASSQGSSLFEYVWKHGGAFQGTVESRNAAFGRSEHGWITDLPNSTVAASFLPMLSDQQNYRNNFISPSGLDLSPVLEHGNALLFAWAGDYSPIQSMRRFSPKRVHRDTLFRVAVPLK